MWKCKKCGGNNIKQYNEEGVFYSYGVDEEGTPIESTQKCEGESGWHNRFLNFSCQDCDSETEDQIEEIADWIE